MRQHKIKNLMRYLISMRHFFCRFSCGKRGKAYKIQMFVDFRKKSFQWFIVHLILWLNFKCTLISINIFSYTAWNIMQSNIKDCLDRRLVGQWRYSIFSWITRTTTNLWFWWYNLNAIDVIFKKIKRLEITSIAFKLTGRPTQPPRKPNIF